MARRTYAEIKLVGGSDYERLLAQKRAARRRYRTKHLELNRERDRVAKSSAYAANPEKFRQEKRNLHSTNPEFVRKRREYARARKYGISPSQFDALVAFQNGKCGICRTNLTESAHVDHCHKTEEVRGLLCSICNTGLGMFSDDPKKLRAAFNYLERGAKRLAIAAQHGLELKEA